MGIIKLLDNNTIDKIAAGEVVERPCSVVKELVENSMDSGALAITVEIKNGGSTFIRVTDNGSGIDKEDMRIAFLRHATSKIENIDDLMLVKSMGFRGEALASISAVSMVEVISKTEDSLMGLRYEIDGGNEKSFDEVGAPNGTTIIVRNLFYNTPARRKFLKSDTAEANAIADTLEHLALARPDISFTFINNNKTKFQTSGNRDIKEIIYRLYGRDTANEVVPIDYQVDDIIMTGYLGKPAINRANRNFETYFINHRFVQNDTVSRAIEEGYKAYLMQHKFPFCVLHFTMDTQDIDVNVHPSKKEVRFGDKQRIFDIISKGVEDVLHSNEMIASVSINEEDKESNITRASEEKPVNSKPLEPFEQIISEQLDKPVINDVPVVEAHSNIDVSSSNKDIFTVSFDEDDEPEIIEAKVQSPANEVKKIIPDVRITEETQYSLFNKEKVLSKESSKDFELIGQVFKTYWLIQFKDNIYFVDQHAAHEKVNYERIMAKVNNNAVDSQQLMPPLVVTLSNKEKTILEDNMEYFERLGFEIEEFGGNEYALRAIPYELYLNNPKEMFLDIMQELMETGLSGTPKVILSRIATFACKASVKGGMEISRDEMEALISEMLTLDNPYHCPHGRPTIFSMSKYELEKKFKRVVD